jgi:hypothetical protein
MPKTVDFGALRKQAEDAGMLGGGDIYKYKEGDNRIRLMSECLPHTSEYQGKKNFKWLCYVLDRRDGKIKVHFMPHKVYKAVEALQLDPDYAFSEVPLPFDINVSAKQAGTVDVEYTVLPARKNTPLTEDEERELYKQKPLDEVQQALKDKQAKGKGQAVAPRDDAPHPADTNLDTPVTELTDEDIPFAWILPFALPLTGLLSLSQVVL